LGDRADRAVLDYGHGQQANSPAAEAHPAESHGRRNARRQRRDAEAPQRVTAALVGRLSQLPADVMFVTVDLDLEAERGPGLLD
jgi:hypothetical protein